MWTMMAGPHTSGAGDTTGRSTNLRVLNEAALPLRPGCSMKIASA